MKIMLYAMYVGLFLLSTSSLAANFTGHWEGVGKGVDSTGKQYQDCDFELYVKHDQGSLLKVESGGYYCGFERDYSSFELKIKGHDLYYRGEKVGTIKGNEITASTENKNFNTKYHLIMKDHLLIYHEKLTLTRHHGHVNVGGVLTRTDAN